MTADFRLYPVIMCGGSGTRLWPASRPSRPKQFLPLVSSGSLFSETVQRLSPLASAGRFVIVAGQRHAGPILMELERLNVHADVLLEPEARDSGPAIAAAAAWIATKDPNGIAVVLASDHHIPDAARFRRCVEQSAAVAWQHRRIVTLGIRPTLASSAYGYIKPGFVLDDSVCDLESFVEKPTQTVAQEYLRAGYLWNSGNFIAPASLLMHELERLAPDVLTGAVLGVRNAQLQGAAIHLGSDFRSARKMSFDYAVMERTDKAAVLPVDVSWSDLGAWDAVFEARSGDENGNRVRGDVVLDGCENNLVDAAPGMVVMLKGVSEMAVVAEPDSVLVIPLAQAQGVKGLVDTLKERNAAQVDIAKEGPSSLVSWLRDLKGWLFGSALPAWLTYGIDHGSYGAVEQLDHAGRADGAPRRARIQPRQAHSFAVAEQLGWRGPSALVIDSAFAAIERWYRQSDGQLVALVGTDGSILDHTRRLYDQAFLLLAMASCQDRIENAEGSALKLLGVIEQAYRSESGGFVETGGLYLSNPLMHLLEAALAWSAHGTSTRWRKLADDIGTLALSRLIDPETGAIGEYFNSDWTLQSGPNGDSFEPGHQFEWAWLLVRLARICNSAQLLDAARRLFLAGCAGIDPIREVAVDGISRSRVFTRRTARLWPQTEWLKASLILSEEAGSEDERAAFVSQALRAARAVRRYLPEEMRGLWHDKMHVDGTFQDGPSPASTLYHLVEAVAQLTRTVSVAERDGWTV